MNADGMWTIELQHLLKRCAKLEPRSGKEKADASAGGAICGDDVVRIVGRVISGIVEFNFLCSCGNGAAKHASKAGAAGDRNNERRDLQRANPVGSDALAINSKRRG